MANRSGEEDVAAPSMPTTTGGVCATGVWEGRQEVEREGGEGWMIGRRAARERKEGRGEVMGEDDLSRSGGEFACVLVAV